MSDPKLTYGIDSATRKLVHISDAVDKKVYLCPKCEEELTLYNHWSLDRVRKPGQRKQYFYSHKHGSNCVGAQMTVLHSLAQKILFEEKKIMLPKYEGKHGYKENSVSREFEKIILENTIVEDGLFRRPDCIARKTSEADPKHDLWIEIYVTHALDDKKISEIRERGTYCVEIDMREFLNVNFTRDSLCNFLLKSSRNRKWICCPVWDKKDEEKGRKDEEEEKARNEKQNDSEEVLKTIVKEWMKTGREDVGKRIIEQLRVWGYHYGDLASELLGANNNVFDYILHSPKNRVGLILFDKLLQDYSYHPQTLEKSVNWALDRIELKRLKKQGYASYDMELQELFALVYYYLEIDVNRDFYANGDRYALYSFRELEKILYKQRASILSDIIRENKTFRLSDLDSLLIRYFPEAFINMSERDRAEEAEQKRRDEENRLFRQQQDEANSLYTEKGFNRRVPNWSWSELNEHIQEQQEKVAKIGDKKENELLQKLLVYKKKHYS